MANAQRGAVVITGASAGFGEASARAFAKLGYPLVLGARRVDKLRAVADACRSLGAPRAHAHTLDVRDAKSIEAFCDAVLRDEPGFEILFNNAGLARGRDPLATVRDEDAIEMIETNVMGVVRMTRRLLPSLLERKTGHVINLGSYAAHGVYEGGAIYAPTKHFVRAMTETLRLETAGSGVRVTQLDPGMAETEFSVVRLGDEQKAKAVYAGFDPLTAEDVAETVVWIATRPKHVNINELVMTASAQASLSKVVRKT